MKLGRLRIKFQNSKLLKLPKFSNVANVTDAANSTIINYIRSWNEREITSN